MGRSKVKRGQLWEYVRPQESTGALQPHWSLAESYRRANTVRLFPPNPDRRCWSVMVDGIEILEIAGPDARNRAFDIAAVFAEQQDPLQKVLRDHGFRKHGR